ncbi:C10 family peptidase [Bacteroides salyersiae]|uniref:C10 family peptidase n=1 Tax=Bacteroides salyersiae TaxID=291644 RepID=UPI0021669AE6|nr:C10 family peptidase [Bacteroides salyersiae]MCS3057464.1 C10 family peptidase [Bacteroides salyersiae]
MVEVIGNVRGINFFLFDGYKADRYHVNWGWGGTTNGYYLLSTLEPDQQGIGGNSGGGFSIGQNAIVFFKKAETGSS